MSNVNHISLASLAQCTGCAACSSVCSHKAIEMRKGELGHLYPYIDEAKCIECGRCVNACPVINVIEPKPIRKAYAAWAIDQHEYKSSVSGGVASVFSRWIIRQGGVVYGCAMLPGVEVKHIRIDKEEDLEKLKGSKYVQSDIREIIPQVVRDVKEKKPVLFIGTPCQVAAIKKMYKTQPQNLYLVDLICHGVPSLDILKKHINKVCPSKEPYNNITFRSGYGFYVVVVVGDALTEIYRSALKNTIIGEDAYLGAFYRGYTYRESCYLCQYANPQRVSDVTIGDFWGLGDKASIETIPEHAYGCSVVLPCTEKGEELVSAVSEYLNCYERPIEEAISGNTQLRHPFKKGYKIKLFQSVFRYVAYLPIYQIFNIDVYVAYWIKKIVKKSKKIFGV